MIITFEILKRYFTSIPKYIYIDQAGRFIPFYLYNPKNVEDVFNLKELFLKKKIILYVNMILKKEKMIKRII